MLAYVIRNAIVAFADRKGVTAAEYAVLAVGIVAVVALAATTLGTRLETALQGILAPDS